MKKQNFLRLGGLFIILQACIFAVSAGGAMSRAKDPTYEVPEPKGRPLPSDIQKRPLPPPPKQPEKHIYEPVDDGYGSLGPKGPHYDTIDKGEPHHYDSVDKGEPHYDTVDREPHYEANPGANHDPAIYDTVDRGAHYEPLHGPHRIYEPPKHG